MAHSAASSRATGPQEPSVGELVQSAMTDMSTLVRAEIELAKTEMSRSAKKAGIGAGAFGAAGVLLAFAGIYFFFFVAELLAEWLPRWAAFLIVFAVIAVAAGLAALVGMRTIKKIEKPERTIESLRELPEVLHREEPGRRRRDLPVVAHGQVTRRDPDSYLV
ncbi:phage holin family protein [Geodermatophilus sp. SYSU D00815]